MLIRAMGETVAEQVYERGGLLGRSESEASTEEMSRWRVSTEPSRHVGESRRRQRRGCRAVSSSRRHKRKQKSRRRRANKKVERGHKEDTERRKDSTRTWQKHAQRRGGRGRATAHQSVAAMRLRQQQQGAILLSRATSRGKTTIDRIAGSFTPPQRAAPGQLHEGRTLYGNSSWMLFSCKQWGMSAVRYLLR